MHRTLAVWLALIPCLATASEDDAFLPAAAGHLQIGRYSPTEDDLHWAGWVGAELSLLRLYETTLAGGGQIETVMGDTRRAFDATQVNYHLGLRMSRPVGAYTLDLFFHHVSRHEVDREKVPAVDWNVLGVRAARRFRRGAQDVRVELGLGHTTLASLINYGWEATVRAEANLLRHGVATLYLNLDVRAVSAEAKADFPRDGFVDSLIEGGLRWSGDHRWVETFLAFERRNDVFLQVPGVRSRLLYGLRLDFSSGGWRRPWLSRAGQACRSCGAPR